VAKSEDEGHGELSAWAGRAGSRGWAERLAAQEGGEEEFAVLRKERREQAVGGLLAQEEKMR
jgi:hypothetical protein